MGVLSGNGFVWCISSLTISGILIDIMLLVMISFIYKSLHYFGLKKCICHFLTICSLISMTMCVSYVSLDWFRLYYIFHHSSDITNCCLRWLVVLNDAIYCLSIIFVHVSLIGRVYAIFTSNSTNVSHPNHGDQSPSHFNLIIQHRGFSALQKSMFIVAAVADLISMSIFIKSIYESTILGNTNDSQLVLSAIRLYMVLMKNIAN